MFFGDADLLSFPQILNFSIAYGKTKHGLSRDWGVSLQEAERTVEAVKVLLAR